MYEVSMTYGLSCLQVVRREDERNTYLQKSPTSNTFRYPRNTYFRARLTYINGYIKFEVRFTGSSYITAIETTDPNPLGAGNIGFTSCGTVNS